MRVRVVPPPSDVARWLVVDETAPLRPLPRPGERVSRYEIVTELAHGGMAAVFVGRHSGIGGFEKLVAVKVMLPHLASDRRYSDMFLDEIRIVSHIAHPNVVQILDVGEHDGLPFMVMELLRGQPLGRVLRRDPIAPGLVLAMLAQVAEGLHAAHETTGRDGEPLGIVHRDVSPQNIHVGYDGQVKILDFGVAAAIGRHGATHSGEIKGKLAFLAPEQIARSRPIDRRADLWALGVMAWQIFADRKLFAVGDDATTLWNVLNAEIPALDEVAPHVPEPVVRCVMACLERDPMLRPSTAREVADVLARAAREAGVEGARPIVEHMERVFATVRAVEDERLAAAVREGPPPPLTDPESSSTDIPAVVEQPTLVEKKVPARRRAAWALGAVATIAIAAAGAWAVGLPSTEPPVRAESAPAIDPRTTEVRGEGEAIAERRRIEVAIDEAATLVLVDGSRRDERPIVLALAPDERATVEVVGRDGRIARRVVDATEERVAIALEGASPAIEATAERAAKRTPRARRRTKNERGADGRPLLGNPY